MESVRQAVIDVGTNSIKVLVADVGGDGVQPVWEESKQTRLGRGFYETHRLQPGAILTTAATVAVFAATARQRGASAIRVIATSAARDAINPGELTEAIERASGLKVEIISGEQEADWVFQGVTTDPALADVPLLLLDVGGGSTEFILGRGDAKHFRQSFPLGSVRLLERIPHSDPPKAEELAACRLWLREFLAEQILPRLGPALCREKALIENGERVQLVGTGGTTSILARMEGRIATFERQRIEGARLSLSRIRWHMRNLWALPLSQRREIIGLPKNRADVILTGVLIFEAVMDQLGFEELRVSTRGLRFAAVRQTVPVRS